MTGNDNVCLFSWQSESPKHSGRHEEVLRLWRYRYTYGIIQDHSIIQICTVDSKSSIVTQISYLDQTSGLVHLLVISPLPCLHINRPTMAAIELSANKMCITLKSVLVVGYLSSMVIPYRQETLFLVTEQTTIHSCSSGVFLGR